MDTTSETVVVDLERAQVVLTAFGFYARCKVCPWVSEYTPSKFRARETAAMGHEGCAAPVELPVWNVLVPVIDLVHAETSEAALASVVQRLERAGFDATSYTDGRSVFESESVDDGEVSES